MKKSDFREEYTPKGIVFIPSYDCTAMCRHCNNNFKAHDLKKRMDADKAVDILYESKKYGLNSLQITGGEITMYPEFMLRVIPHAKKLTMRVNKPPTNGYIGKDREKASVFFSGLKDANYTSGFRISIDPYHQKKIPVKWTAVFAAEYIKFFRPSSLTIGSCYYDIKEIYRLYDEFIREMKNAGVKDVRLSKKEKRFYINGQKLKFGIWKPTRPAWKELKDNEVEMRKITATLHCLGPHGVGYLWIEPDLKVRVCSCNGNNFTDYLVIGDLNRQSLSGIISKARRDKIFIILANYGPAGLRDVLNLKGKVLDKDKKYSFMCEICHEILTNTKLREKVLNNFNSMK